MFSKSGGDFANGRAAWGLLIVRLVFGSALLMHGWAKIGAPLSWLDATRVGVPAPLQLMVCAGELAGGLALIFGFLTPLAAAGILVMMIGAATVVHGAAPWTSEIGGPSKEPSLGYGAVALLMLLNGPGRYSIDAWLLKRLKARNSG